MPSEPTSAPTASVGASGVGDDDSRALEEVARQVASEAADLVRGRLGLARIVDIKTTPTDVVTQADIEAETMIRGLLLEATPGAAICGEEGGAAGGSTSLRWIVDPIDGTINFLYDLPVMSVSIAAEVHGVVSAGAVADVVRGEVFSGSLGNGVVCDGVSVGPSGETDLGQSLVATGFSYSAEQRGREAEVVTRVIPATRDIRNFGSAALHLAWVACGRLEGFYQRGLHEWDLAAGAFLAAEAGARVELGSAENGGLVLAAAAGIYEQLRRLITG